MPIPVSITSIRTAADAFATSWMDKRSVTPPALVNLTALPSRLISTCLSRSGSPSTGGRGTRGRSTRRSRPWRLDAGATVASACSRTRQLEGDVLHCSLPASIFEKSRMSSMTCNRCRPTRGRWSRTRAARASAACRTAAWSCRARRSSASGFHGSCVPGTRSWHGRPTRRRRGHGATRLRGGCAPSRR